MISFGLSEEQELIRDTLREFATEAMRPIARDCDETAQIPQDFLDTIWELGLTNTQIAEQYGVTLCCFVRDGRFNIYTHVDRVC